MRETNVNNRKNIRSVTCGRVGRASGRVGKLELVLFTLDRLIWDDGDVWVSQKAWELLVQEQERSLKLLQDMLAASTDGKEKQ